jgi:2-polyprenyl-3-methyl-5-hydroxy-6-metoxy-1,4-benzoquinol methylase
MAHPEKSLRNLEWSGLADLVDSFREAGGKPPGDYNVLDFGCGNGLLAEFLRQRGFSSAAGWDRGWMADLARRAGKPVLTEMPAPASQDMALAIEVIEHAVDPLAFLSEIRKLLRPGGIFLLTTGNASPWLDRLDRWSYVRPEIHNSYFTPKSLSLAFAKTGFRAEPHAFGAAWKKIILYKILKNLGLTGMTPLTTALSKAIGPLSAWADRRYGVTAMPYAAAE